MNFEDMTPDQQAKAKACTSFEEMVSLAREEGVELTDEQLDDISGGAWYSHCESVGGDEKPGWNRPAD